MIVFIPTPHGVVIMDYEDRLKFPGTIYAHQGDRKINIFLYHNKKAAHGHRLIMGVTRRDLMVDHKNGNRFDWRKKNLRVVKAATNNVNKADYNKNSDLPRGVYKKGKKLIARIVVDHQVFHLGTFTDPVEAGQAFIAAHKLYHGKNSFYNMRSI